jgi:hypothetical protein
LTAAAHRVRLHYAWVVVVTLLVLVGPRLVMLGGIALIVASLAPLLALGDGHGISIPGAGQASPAEVPASA